MRILRRLVAVQHTSFDSCGGIYYLQRGKGALQGREECPLKGYTDRKEQFRRPEKGDILRSRFVGRRTLSRTYQHLNVQPVASNRFDEIALRQNTGKDRNGRIGFLSGRLLALSLSGGKRRNRYHETYNEREPRYPLDTIHTFLLEKIDLPRHTSTTGVYVDVER
ncbi:hypothetical protein L21SP2_0379 [Salinispira pacifica]|uniref:Uncharacterized protein n=1 Tax=Salinispira pacifica TaxID=1307761 RepID=V5WDA9_9SPIO|nr:hypothetical protein L21SP2_0379 [Salinispira pacifica]